MASTTFSGPVTSTNGFITTGTVSFTTQTVGTLTVTTSIVSNTSGGIKIGTATNQKLGFFNKAPVAQQSTTGTTTGFTAGSGTASKDDSTYTGGSGTKAYTVGDIVLALKNLGLLAAS